MKRALFGCVLLIWAFTGVGFSNPPGDSGIATGDRSTLQADTLSWWSVDGGGGTSIAGDVRMTSSIGQPDAHTAAGSGLVLDGGVWSVAIDSGLIFADGFESGDTSGWSGKAGPIATAERGRGVFQGGE